MTAVVAIMEPATESSSKRPQISLTSHPSNKIRVLLDKGSNGDLFFHEKGTPKPFPYLTRQVPKFWHTSNGTFHTHGRGRLRIKFLDYSASREYLVQPDIVEYDGTTMSKPGFDLILGTNTLKTTEIDINEIIFPTRDISKLSTRAKIERVWMANNNVMIHEPKSTLVATQRVVKILDAKYEKADLNAAIADNCKHLSIPDQEKLLKRLTKFKDLFDGTLGD